MERSARDSASADAYDAFFRSSWSALYGQAYVLTGSAEQAQDLTQEALLRTWTHWDRVSGYENPAAWTRKVLHNLCIASWRRARTRRHEAPTGTGVDLEVVAMLPAAAAMPDDHLRLAQAMRRLPGPQARALLLHDGLGFSVAETAAELDAPEGTVTSWLHRSRKIVAAALDRSDGSDRPRTSARERGQA
ncbi:MAG: RNA polymerase sigma factor [Acidimicrobiales bacterium]